MTEGNCEKQQKFARIFSGKIENGGWPKKNVDSHREYDKIKRSKSSGAFAWDALHPMMRLPAHAGSSAWSIRVEMEKSGAFHSIERAGPPF